MDLTASTHQRKDFNGQPCALVKVGLRAPGATFEGNIIGDTEFHTNEYWVYMTAGSKMLNIKHLSAKSLMVKFPDYYVDKLQSKMTYVLELELPSTDEPEVQQNVFINFSPSSAVVLVNGKILKTTNGSATTKLIANKEYNYIVAADGYESSEGNFLLKASAPTRLNVQLYPTSSEETPEIAHPIQPIQQPEPTIVQHPEIDTSALCQEIETAYNNGLYNNVFELCSKIEYSPCAQKKLGLLYKNGYAVRQSNQEYVKWFMKAANQNDEEAQYVLGTHFEEGSYGVSKSNSRALTWYRKAAEQGHAEAQYKLGYMFENGKGGKKDLYEATRWYKKAGEQDVEQAQVRLGMLYGYSNDIKRDYEEAAKWFKRLADKNNSIGCACYGVALFYGNGVAKNLKESYTMLTKAADMGHENAKYFLKSHKKDFKIFSGK
ncbi:MAG: sel1 repeat family protein [Muribaculum sp.]|nr:sel1 repeat family protein [Muribaculaceae bacterium]MCM1081270.1 sel1 repeat family protein [Muribaculum sp.]